jgi:hypothetical protein
MQMVFHPITADEHVYAEEQQWVNILARDNPSAGIVLLYIQKLCTVFHEYGPMSVSNVLTSDSLPFVRKRLLARIDYLLDLMRRNGWERLQGVTELRGIRERLKGLTDITDISDLAEEVHQINHMLCDDLHLAVT